MSEIGKDQLTPESVAVVDAVQAYYDAVLGKIAEQRQQRGDAEDGMNPVVAADNVLKLVLTAVFSRMVPFEPVVAVEVAGRAASLSISTAPAQTQPLLAEALASNFVQMHAQRMLRGGIIQSVWVEEHATKQ